MCFPLNGLCFFDLKRSNRVSCVFKFIYISLWVAIAQGLGAGASGSLVQVPERTKDRESGTLQSTSQ